MLISFANDSFPEEYVPTVFENYQNELTVGSQVVKYSLWDTAGQEGFTRIRTLSYPNTDVFLLCYAVDNPDSLLNIKDRWVKEVDQHCPGTPKILVATKIDLRGASSVPSTDGKKMAEEIGASAYLECSAKTREGLEDVFKAALDIVLEKRHKELGGDSATPVKSKEDSKKEGCIIS
jgi:small GTP-binding protein